MGGVAGGGGGGGWWTVRNLFLKKYFAVCMSSDDSLYLYKFS